MRVYTSYDYAREPPKAYMWCVARYGISHYLAFPLPLERMRMHAKGFLYLYVVSICLHKLVWHSSSSNVRMPFKRVNTSNLMTLTFKWCFLKQFYFQCSAMFSLVYGFYLVMQQVTNTVSLLKFQTNVQVLSVILKKVFQDHYS